MIELSVDSRVAAVWFLATTERDVLSIIYKAKVDEPWTGWCRIRQNGTGAADPFSVFNNDRKSWLSITPSPDEELTTTIRKMRSAMHGMRDNLPSFFGTVKVFDEVLFHGDGVDGLTAFEQLQSKSWVHTQAKPSA